MPSLNEWNSTLVTVAGLTGAAAGWIAKRGVDTYLRLRRARDSRIDDLVKKSNEDNIRTQILEDKSLHSAHKALLLLQDQRIRQLERTCQDVRCEMEKLHAAHLECVQLHAAAEEKAMLLEKQLDIARSQLEAFERRYSRLRNALKVREDETGNRIELEHPKQGGEE